MEHRWRYGREDATGTNSALEQCFSVKGKNIVKLIIFTAQLLFA